jgi:glycosyltransferase involved in cell wall biosynthesis
MKKKTCLVGIFPPPLHGMSLINLYVMNLVAKKGPYLVINYSPKTLNRHFYVGIYKLILIPKNLINLLLALNRRQIGSIYIGLSAGKGQIFDLLFIGLGRLFRRNLFLHHHSYSYINKPTLLSRSLFFLAGKNVRHIVSTKTMQLDLKSTYKVKHVENISGIFALDSWKSSRCKRETINVVGYLSNISFEKGIIEFLETAEVAQKETPNIKFILAGPFQDLKIKSYLIKKLALLGNVEYIGSLVGDSKRQFYESIDLFLFPTKNQDESEGLVIHEAMSMGIPVILHKRKQVFDILNDDEGIIVDLNERYAFKVIELIKKCDVNHSILPILSNSAYQRAKFLKEKNTLLIDSLCKKISEDS